MVKKKKRMKNGAVAPISDNYSISSSDSEISNMSLDINDVPKSNINENKNEKQNVVKSSQDATADKYLNSDKGPFYVSVEKEGINEMVFGRYLMSKNIRDISEIMRTGKNTIRIKCNNVRIANKIIEHRVLKDEGYKCFIPRIFTTSIGIINYIPLEITVEEIKSQIICACNIVNIERMEYYDKESSSYKPGQKIKITFRSGSLPSEVKLFYTIRQVTRFVEKPMFCKNCLAYGHSKKYCKKDQKCNNCAEEEVHENCTKPAKCANCKIDNNHKTTDAECNEKKIQVEIRRVMVEEKLPYRKANFQVRKKFTIQQNKTNEKNNESIVNVLKSQVDENNRLLDLIAKNLMSNEKINDGTKLLEIGRIMNTFIIGNKERLFGK